MKAFKVGKFNFLLDIPYKQIVNEDESIAIPIRKMRDMKTHYEFYMDENTGQFREFVDITVDIGKMPQMVDIDPEGIRNYYGIADNKRLPVRDFFLKSNEARFHARVVEGKHPRLKIDDQLYCLDFQRSQLYPLDDTGNVIPEAVSTNYKEDFIMHSNHMELYFNRKEQRIVPWREIERNFNYQNLPLEIDRFKLPPVIFIDPVGYARSQKLTDNYYSGTYPLQDVITARHLPIEPHRRVVMPPVKIQRIRKAGGNRNGLK